MKAAPPATVIVPLKALRQAKGRLSAVLTADERRTLTLDMFAHVLGACAGVPALTRVLVVAGDRDAARAARYHGAEVIEDPGGGLNAAVSAADRQVTDATSLVLAADLPDATAGEIAHLLDLASDGAGNDGDGAGNDGDVPGTACVLVAPTTDGGTAALLRRPSRVIGPAYGPDSCARHLAAGAAVGAVTAVVALPGLARDVDRPADLAAGWPGNGAGRPVPRAEPG